MYEIENPYSTHEITEVKNFNYLLREIGMS